MIEDRFERTVDCRVRLALGKQAAQRRQMSDAVDGVRRRQITARAQIEPFDGVISKMLVEPRPPGRAQCVARLQHPA